MRKFAVSDIHGCIKTFETLLEQLQFSCQDELYLLGDLIDRGNGSKDVLDLIFRLQREGHTIHCIRGNHEQQLIDSLTDEKTEFTWTAHNGGADTLHSFKASRVQEIKPIYTNFLKSLPYYLEVDQYLLVHAGFNFKKNNVFADQHSMLWARNWYREIDFNWLNGRIIVHGHTPAPRSYIKNQLQRLSHLPVLDIDCGCYFRVPDLGQLCAFQLDTKELYFQRNIEL